MERVVVGEWNNLPSGTINAKALESSKHKLDKYKTDNGWVETGAASYGSVGCLCPIFFFLSGSDELPK